MLSQTLVPRAPASPLYSVKPIKEKDHYNFMTFETLHERSSLFHILNEPAVIPGDVK